MVAEGGKGGRGNMAFASNRNKAPDFAEQGDLGQTFLAKVELQVLADVGLLGYPNVGKSTLISRISNAKAKIADYQFTTLSPQLGMVNVEDDAFVVADLPGLIEFAHLGVGLGLQFLKHVERCRILLHIVAMDSIDPVDDYKKINNELVLYDEKLKDRTQIVVANKMDVEGAEENLEKFKQAFKDIKIIPISALMNEGLQILKYEIATILKTIPKFEPKDTTKHYILIADELKRAQNKKRSIDSDNQSKIVKFSTKIELHEKKLLNKDLKDAKQSYNFKLRTFKL